jgi:hypothetical protein
MKLDVSLRSLLLIAIFAVLTGCATSRSEIKLSSPVAVPTDTVVSNGKTIVIRSVQDERVFEQAPTDPSTPSLGLEGSAKASADTKSRAIGRKRNTWGKALGDVLLQNGQTVESVIRENLKAAFEQAGYQVKTEDTAGPSPLLVDVHIKQFWSWFQPGFWALTLNANISTDLTLSGAQPPTTISVHSEEKRQMATDGAWMDIVDQALKEYRTEVVTKSKTFP